MRISKVIISGTAAVAAWKIDIPTGIIGAQVQLVFADPVWEGMHKTISFEGAAEVEPIVDPGEMVKIPAAVVSESNTSVKIGITGIPADGSEMIPTLWAELGTTKPAPVINCEDESIPPLWAQLLTKLGDLEDLNTENKSNLVAAVNEVLATGGNGSNVDLSGYVKSVNGVAPDENGNVEIKVGSDSGQNPPQDGEDGFSPIATVTQTANGAVITITDKGGTTTATVTNGKDGEPGEPGPQGPAGEAGYSPVRGTDYWTEEDKVEIREYCLPQPATAAAGQFLKVTAVDEGGKVTAVEATDAPTLPGAEGVAF